MEHDAPRRLDRVALENFRVPEGPAHGLDELLLHVLQPADILPGHVGDLHEDLPDRRGVYLHQGRHEMAHPHLEGGDLLVGDLLRLEVDVGEDVPDAGHRGLLGQRLEVRADEPVGEVGHAFEIDILRERHAARVDLEDLEPSLAVGDRHGDLAVEAPRAAQGRVQGVGDVRGPDDDDLSARLEPVHQRQQLSHDPALHLLLAPHVLALRGDGVDLVDEDDGGGAALGLLEDVAQAFLALPVEFSDDLGAGDVGEPCVGLVRHGPSDDGLARTGRAVEEHPLGRLDP